MSEEFIYSVSKSFQKISDDHFEEMFNEINESNQ